MARIKYYYDTETCQYEKAKVRKGDIIFNTLGFLVFTVLLASGLAVGYNALYMSPTEVKLKKENRELKKHYNILEAKVGEVNNILQALQVRDDEIYRKIYEVEPLTSPMRNAGIGGNERNHALLTTGFSDRELVDDLYNQIHKVTAKAAVQNQSYQVLTRISHENEIHNLPTIQPVKNNELDKLASGYGMRIHPIHKGRYKHSGIDFAATRGTPIYATANGVIKLAKTSNELTGYGNQIEIDHENGYVTKYAHLEKMLVKEGEAVKRGQILGLVGNSGGSVAPHLHYEVIRKGEKINPIFYMLLGLNEDQYDQLLILSARENQSFD